MAMKSITQEFKTFILRGNVVDLAVGIIIGAAFSAVVNALVKDLLTPLIAAIFGKRDFSAITFTIHKSQFLIGDFINVVISFITIALVVFFVVVKPVNFLMSHRQTELPADPTTRDCPHCLSSIPLKASVCPFCTRDIPVSAATVTA
jgi:large conductance mechanosensitive channel